MSEINNERNSAPTGASELENEMNLEAKDPLGGAACSDSSLLCGGATEPEDILNWIGSKLEPIGFVRKS